jgi:hypothetical protein
MRSTLLVLALAFLFTIGVNGQAGSLASPNTPPDGDSNAETMCLLASLTFTNGFILNTPFSPTQFDYTCSCAAMSQSYTVATPTLEDVGSSAEITMNGVMINFRSMGNAISDNGAVANSPNTQSGQLNFVTGNNVMTIGVGCNGLGTPETCYYIYTITCNKPPPQGGFVVGDPQFVGLRGQNYQVHGVSGEIYNIVSDVELQYNSRFVFLNQGECPVVEGRKLKGCWSHPGSYLGELGLKTKSGDKIHVVSGDAKVGFTAVEVNGKALAIGDTVLLADNMGSVTLNSTHVTSVSIGNWDFAFENSDMFVNQRVRVLDARGLRSHGLLGQTWRETVYPNAVKYVQGAVDDYVIRDNDIFGDNFVFNTFN